MLLSLSTTVYVETQAGPPASGLPFMPSGLLPDLHVSACLGVPWLLDSPLPPHQYGTRERKLAGDMTVSGQRNTDSYWCDLEAQGILAG